MVLLFEQNGASFRANHYKLPHFRFEKPLIHWFVWDLCRGHRAEACDPPHPPSGGGPGNHPRGGVIAAAGGRGHAQEAPTLDERLWDWPHREWPFITIINMRKPLITLHQTRLVSSVIYIRTSTCNSMHYLLYIPRIIVCSYDLFIYNRIIVCIIFYTCNSMNYLSYIYIRSIIVCSYHLLQYDRILVYITVCSYNLLYYDGILGYIIVCIIFYIYHV
jgi:hypothetical protein